MGDRLGTPWGAASFFFVMSRPLSCARSLSAHRRDQFPTKALGMSYFLKRFKLCQAPTLSGSDTSIRSSRNPSLQLTHPQKQPSHPRCVSVRFCALRNVLVCFGALFRCVSVRFGLNTKQGTGFSGLSIAQRPYIQHNPTNDRQSATYCSTLQQDTAE